MKIMVDYVISRHKSFIDFVFSDLFNKIMKEKGFEVDFSNAEIKSEITPQEINGKIVVTSGLPTYLATLAKLVIEPIIIYPRDVEERKKILEKIEKDVNAFLEVLKDIEVFFINRIDKDFDKGNDYRIIYNSNFLEISTGTIEGDTFIERNREIIFKIPEKISKEGSNLTLVFEDKVMTFKAEEVIFLRNGFLLKNTKRKTIKTALQKR